MAGPRFDKDFDPRYGEAVRVSPLIRRITARNPGPFTFTGTNSWLVGERALAVIDPGPDDPDHIACLLAAIGRADVAAIVITHTHRDHSPAAAVIAAATGAPILAEGPHRPSRPLALGETNPLDASGDHAFRFDRRVADGDRIEGDGWTLEAIATPGHCANHLAFALPEEDAVFSGDHVMAWSTSIVAPPDGAMSDYMASLERMMARTDGLYWPGHGGPVREPGTFLADLKAHRLGREKAVLDRVAAGDATIPDMVRVIYAAVDPHLHGAAGLSVLAHLEDLVARGLIACDGPVAIDGRYRPA
ncbi:MBL fold metallo-hydrolase [Prosthecomicrobium hirschii]|uniref:MBL fold metallo-hydrolase n=1 Tax=Prosthecodimorpha hirschii TaxID=665126 RepID=UPI0022204D4A|nr:MBL fold metallo-hydrolase [Prosthecomicrobium hirschii]MCW1843858.1 MBL fold metallo-hydrolase [Prosthecomicrobium hirschii]